MDTRFTDVVEGAIARQARVTLSRFLSDMRSTRTGVYQLAHVVPAVQGRHDRVVVARVNGTRLVRVQ